MRPTQWRGTSNGHRSATGCILLRDFETLYSSFMLRTRILSRAVLRPWRVLSTVLIEIPAKLEPSRRSIVLRCVETLYHAFSDCMTYFLSFGEMLLPTYIRLSVFCIGRCDVIWLNLEVFLFCDIKIIAREFGSCHPGDVRM